MPGIDKLMGFFFFIFSYNSWRKTPEIVQREETQQANPICVIKYNAVKTSILGINKVTQTVSNISKLVFY